MTVLLPPAEVVKQRLLPYAETTLRVSRCTGQLAGVTAPLHLKIGSKVFYLREDLEDWMAQFKKRRHTGDIHRAGGDR